MHITDYEKVKSLLWNNLFLLDGGDELGTKTIFAGDLANALMGLVQNNVFVERLKEIDAEAFYNILDSIEPLHPLAIRRNVFRGKNLGTVITDEQWTEIKAGTFKGMFIGDYWLIGGKHWRIADFDYWYRCGRPQTLDHHVMIIADECFLSGPMYSTNNVSGGLWGSRAYDYGNGETSFLGQHVKNDVIPYIGMDHLVVKHELVSNSVTNDGINGTLEVDVGSVVPDEMMIIGSKNESGMNAHGSPTFNITDSTTQLALMALNKESVLSDHAYWLRDIVNIDSFAIIQSDTGRAFSELASREKYFRPVFAIK